MKEYVEGIVLILSCQKHKDTRMKEYALSKDEFCKWKVIYVIGDLFLESEYRLEKNILYVKCEDSYVHLLKKLVFAMKSLYEVFDIQQGFLRAGDDVIFNETKLNEFLTMENKPDYYGNSPLSKSVVHPNKDTYRSTTDDYFMVKYYETHPEDFSNPQHNLQGVNIANYVRRPRVDNCAGGNMYYVSNRSCKLLLERMEQIQYNIFHFDEFSQSYPYTIEDCAVGFILLCNGIDFTYSPIVTTSENMLDLHDRIGISTDKYK